MGIQETNSGVSTGLEWLTTSGEKIESFSPVDGNKIGTVSAADKESYEKVMQKAEVAFKHWRMVPAPKRGELVRQIGEALRQYKEPLGKLVSY